MAESQDSSEIHWINPTRRGIFPLNGFHISRSLRKTILAGQYQARFDTDFEGVLRACADRSETWINAEIHDLYMQLHRAGHAHSQEIWDGEELIGGVYGVSIGGAFFGESMFSKRRDASKIALAWLIDRLNLAGYSLFDTQFMTPHLESLGAIEIERVQYLNRLSRAISLVANISKLKIEPNAYDVIQRNTQTS